ncbi:DUF262 domain-containing protein [uncultured Sphingomonas sp.]|uniref:DUF262 domain-containing protein n=1 Tax=uncultured Sphingomonas sp. TaxID=158754 RepID=UPI00260EDC3A|nr:DUF262 domain-containing protein [uncultured Sphingomonas sp.]
MIDLFNEELPHDQQEDASDLDLQPDWFTGPTLWSTDWTTETIVSQLRRGNINLNPRYQRRNAWDSVRKSLFIESLILGLPIPQIILAEERNQRGRFIVIDGKQRLLAIRQFASKRDDADFPQLRLTGLSDRTDLNGLTYEKLHDDDRLRDDLNNFENQTVRTVVIRGWQNEKYLYSVFLRINTGSVQLSPQELRQALHPGRFSDLIDDVSIQSEALKSALKLKEPDFRMRDVELVLRWFAYRNFAGAYNGDLKKFLDNTTSYFNKSWDATKDNLAEQAKELDAALGATRTIFGDRDELRKWNGRTYEKPINRAVFDIMTYYFSFPAVREEALKHSAELKAAFQYECDKNQDFLSSLEATTKSIDANRVRFGVWARVLTSVLGVAITSPMER